MDRKPLKILSAIPVVVALAFPFLLALEKIAESDTFWHLKTGQWIIAHSAVPRVDPFSATAEGKAWLDWEWLFQAAMYVVYAGGGFSALVAAKATVVFLTALIVFFACRRNGAGAPLAALLVMAAFVAARERLEVRPDVAMLFFAAATIALLEAARRGKPRWLLLLPVMELVWVNVHASFLLGIALAMAYFAGAIFVRAASPPRSVEPPPPKSRWDAAPTRFGVIILLAVFACFINPYGIELFGHAIEQTRSSSPSGTIGEWLPTRLLLLTEPNWALNAFWWLFWLNPVVLIAVLAIKRREFPWTHALVVAGMSFLALRANRFTALYAVVTAPILAHGLGVVREKLAGKDRSVWGEVTASFAVVPVAAVLIFVVVTNRWAVVENRPPKFGVGVDESVVPMRALAVLAKLPAGLNIFNTFLSGGPLIWQAYPQWRPFCDGRANLYGREFVDRYRRAMFDPVEWEKWMRERSVSVAYLQYGTADDRGLLQYLARSPLWDLLYFDQAACIFVHRSSWDKLRADEKLADLKPVRVTDGKTVTAYAHQLADETGCGNSYSRARVVTTIGNFLLTIGAVDTAHALFEDAVAIHPRPSQAWMNLAVIKLDEGDTKQAVELTGKLLAINPRYFYARLLQAQAEATEGDLDAAVANVDEVLRSQPHSAQAWLLRAQLAARQGDRPAAIRALQRTAAERVEDAHLFLFLGQLLAAEGRTNEAVAAYEKSLHLWNGPLKQREQLEAELAKLRARAKK